ncbi:MAG: hypothetical protein ACKO0V_24720, partial [bacterium]
QAESLMEYHIHNFSEHKTEMQIVLTRIYISQNRRDEAALVFHCISRDNLTPRQTEQLNVIQSALEK